MGLGFAMTFDPQHAAQVPTMSSLLTVFVMLLFMAFDGPQVMINTLLESFRILPIGQSLLKGPACLRWSNGAAISWHGGYGSRCRWLPPCWSPTWPLA
ncbi:flagellar biosynthetic protein FliR [Paludibacterium denitrificans]|uniref:flagellar biosynthetic protein FliR n=1 Tax=Paludibacterium denitrificans TaxID=2675226 RepID=UPI0028A8231E|nr:flagellar biosynthetic protein FliR [Paludibacterium denitrificans]